MELTRRLAAAGVLMGIDVIDHVVLGDIPVLELQGGGAPVSRVLLLQLLLGHLRRTMADYVERFHRERNHQGLANEPDRRRTRARTYRPHSPSSAARRTAQLLLSGSVMRREDRFDSSAQRWNITRVPQ